MMTTRKNKLMIAAAVAALMTGSGFALAQDSSPATKAPSAAPAEKMAPAPNAAQKAPSAAEQKAPSAADKGAQKSEDKSLPSKRSSETKPANKSKSETTGQAPSGDKSTTTKSDTTKSDTTKSDTTKSDTTTQSPPKATQDKAAQDKAGTTTSQPNQATGPGTNQKSGGTAGTTNNTTNVSVNLSPEQRTKIHQVIVSDRNAPRLARVDFQLNVGVAVPRSVKLAAVPTTIIEIQPSWRGFEYFLVGDQIVIVNPRTMEIVAVIPA
ncbi:MAG: hypothetical protein QOG74_1394 [Alphaproteobacteria bacterium]|nr:hypothetical protein [Alphaproteobacteria bacterium]